MVAEEVNQALARLQSAAARVVQADRALRTGIITLNGTFEGLEQTSRFGDVLVLITRPQEAVYALQLLHAGLRRVLHDGGRVQPGAVRALPRAGLPGAGGGARSGPPGEVRAGGHRPAALPAPGGQRPAAGHPMQWANGRQTAIPPKSSLRSWGRSTIGAGSHASHWMRSSRRASWRMWWAGQRNRR